MKPDQKTRRYSPTERIGVNAVERIVLDELGWIFRPETTVDMGIDAQVELVNTEPTGKLIALQIKTGLSHFNERDEDFTYYGSTVHLNYWLGHSLPVILVAHFPETKATLWSAVTESGVTRTAKGWRLQIPKTRIFGPREKDNLARLFTPDESGEKDSLTNLLSRYGVRAQLQREIEHSLGLRQALSIVNADLDTFKSVNKRYGYIVGDEVLQQAAKRLQRFFADRANFIGRVGGDEFVILLPNTELNEAQRLAEELRIDFETTAIATADVGVALTLSCGIATLGALAAATESPTDSLLRAADTATYKAKVAGRNCVRSS